MNKRQAKKRKKYIYLLCGKYIYVKPSEWNKVKNKSRHEQMQLCRSKLTI